MNTIVDSGQARNLTTVPTRDGLAPDPTERKYVTFINELGAVHTIIVDVEHGVQEADKLLTWFEHTKAAIALSHGDRTSPLFKAPEEVLRIADEALGIADRATEGNQGQQQPSGLGGVV